MKSPTLEQRIRNNRRTPAGQRERCRYCDDNGYVAVAVRVDTWMQPTGARPELKTTSAEHEEYGPCPMCVRGFYEEHGDPDHPSSIEPPWGPLGFWQDRDIPELVPLGIAGVERAPMPGEARAWLASIGVPDYGDGGITESGNADTQPQSPAPPSVVEGQFDVYGVLRLIDEEAPAR